jgi:2,6-dihydroxypyridine 3-monooxygenase
MRVAIIGGSLGGLSAALVLRDLGHDVTIYERSPKPLEERGAGIGFMPETYRYLVERGGLDLDTISIVTDHLRHWDRSGQTIHDRKHTYRFSSWNTVYRELLRLFGTERYLLGREVTALDQTGEVVHLTVENQLIDATANTDTGNSADNNAQRPTATVTTVEADLVVCADGVGSKFRSRLLPGASPVYSGYVAWRGIVPEGELPVSITEQLTDAITYMVFANSHILVYPIPGVDGSVKPGERLLNFVWYRNYLAGGDFDDLMLGIDGVRREVSIPPGLARVAHVAEMRATAHARLPIAIAAVVQATKQPFVQVVLDVEVPQMVFGRICLLGDSAWVARPHAAAGTAKAADDAWSLAESLSAHDNVDMALAVWEKRQLGVGRQLVDRTRRIGSRSQQTCTWNPADDEHLFGLHGPGLSS